MWTKVFKKITNSKVKVEVMFVCKQTLCLHFGHAHFLKYDVLSEYPMTFMFVTLLNEYEVVLMFRSVAIDERARTPRSTAEQATCLFPCSSNFRKMYTSCTRHRTSWADGCLWVSHHFCRFSSNLLTINWYKLINLFSIEFSHLWMLRH